MPAAQKGVFGMAGTCGHCACDHLDRSGTHSRSANGNEGGIPDMGAACSNNYVCASGVTAGSTGTETMEKAEARVVRDVDPVEAWLIDCTKICASAMTIFLLFVTLVTFSNLPDNGMAVIAILCVLLLGCAGIARMWWFTLKWEMANGLIGPFQNSNVRAVQRERPSSAKIATPKNR